MSDPSRDFPDPGFYSPSHERRVAEWREFLEKNPEWLETSIGTGGGIYTWADIPLVGDVPDLRVEWLCDGFLPRGGIVLLAGEAGAFKTWLAQRLAKGVATGSDFLGRACQMASVLYLDRENPAALVRKRIARLGVVGLPNFRYWGAWASEAAPAIGDFRLLEAARSERPLIVFDSLVRFHDADENSATEMGAVMSELRRLADAGASVLCLHHKAKTESSSYRGSSDIAAGVDMGIALSKDPASGILKLRVFKNRFEAEFSLSVRPDLEGSGDFLVCDGPGGSSDEADIAALTRAIEANPGATQGTITEVAGLSQKRGRALLNTHTGEHWETERGSRTTKRYFPLDWSPHAKSDA